MTYSHASVNAAPADPSLYLVQVQCTSSKEKMQLTENVSDRKEIGFFMFGAGYTSRYQQCNRTGRHIQL